MFTLFKSPKQEFSGKRRICSKCNVEKALEYAFHKDLTRGKDGYAQRCIDCRHAQQRLIKKQKAPKVALEKKKAPQPKKTSLVAPTPIVDKEIICEISDKDLLTQAFHPVIHDERIHALEEQLKEKTSYHQTWDKHRKVYHLQIYAKEPKLQAKVSDEDLKVLYEKALHIVQ